MFKGIVSTPNFTPHYPACTQPVRPVATAGSTPQVRPVTLTGQIGPRKTEGLHTQPSRVQPDNSLAQGSRSTTSHPSASRRMNLTQQGQKSTSEWPEMNVATNLSILILSKTYPTIGYIQPTYLDMQSFLAGGLFCRNASIDGSLFSIFQPHILYRQTLTNVCLSTHACWSIQLRIQNSIHFYISIILTHSLRDGKEIKALISARHGESIRFNLARWT